MAMIVNMMINDVFFICRINYDANIVQASGKKTCFQFPERRLCSVNIVQASGKKTRFHFPECSISFAKIQQSASRIK